MSSPARGLPWDPSPTTSCTATGSSSTTLLRADAASSAGRGRPAICRNLIAQGVNAPGAFADYVITDADRCFVVDDLAPEAAVLAEPVACVVHGLDVLALRPVRTCCCSAPVRLGWSSPHCCPAAGS